MNKVRISGLGMVMAGIFIGYYFNRTDIHLLSGMLIGVGVGWLITGRLLTSNRQEKTTIKSD